MQQSNLKALSEAILQRNPQRNKSATEHEKPRNNSTPKQPHLLRDVVPPLRTFDQAHDALNSLGNWTPIADLAAIHCPELLKAARQADQDVDNHIVGIERYYQAWRDVYIAARKGHHEEEAH